MFILTRKLGTAARHEDVLDHGLLFVGRKRSQHELNDFGQTGFRTTDQRRLEEDLRAANCLDADVELCKYE